MMYKYNVRYFDNIEDEVKIASGIVYGQTLSAAVKHLEEFYGEIETERVSIFCTEADGEVFEMKSVAAVSGMAEED